MWYSASFALFVVTLLSVSTEDQRKRSRAAVGKRPYARILESRVLPSGKLRIVVPFEDTFIRNGRRVARVRPYYCKKKIIETNAGREFYTMGYCRPIVWYRRTTKGSTVSPTTTEVPAGVTTVRDATTDITSANPADLSTGETLEITTNSPTMSTTTSSVQTDVTTGASATTTPRVSTESSTTTTTEESRGEVTTSAATESMTTITTTITMLDSTTSAAAAAAVKSSVKVAARNQNH